MMHLAIEKTEVLIEALSYIRSFSGKLVVVKLGGSAMDKEESLACAMDDLAFLQAVGIRPVVVHGGGPAISKEMQRQGKEPVFAHGRRITDPETMRIVEDVLINVINRHIVELLQGLHVPAKGLHVRNVQPLLGRKLPPMRTPEGTVDLGRVGEMTGVNAAAIRGCTNEGTIPVIAPIAVDKEGGALNVNADSAAAKVAAELRAAKLVFVSDTHGIYTKAEDKTSLASTLRREEIEKLIRSGVIDGGMLPKVEGCLDAVENGVGKAHIIDGRIRHSLLLEIFTEEGIGTEVVL
ncbi:MAG: acetylglutamate kinase [Planctomycetota bacterium]